MNRMIKRGDIVMVKLGNNRGSSIQSKTRACIIVSNNKANEFSPVIHVVPITSKDKKNLPTHVRVGISDGFKKQSIAMAEQTIFVSKEDILGRIGEVNAIVLDKLDFALAVQFGMIDKINAIINSKQRMGVA